MRRWLPGRKRPAQPKGPFAPFARFTDRARQVVFLAQEEARRLNHNYIGTEHILLGLLREGEGVAAQVLAAFGAGHARVREQVLRLLTGDSEQAGPRRCATGKSSCWPTGHLGGREPA